MTEEWPAARPDYEDLNACVLGEMGRWTVPGIAAGVWQDGHMETFGHGVASLETRQPVTGDTLFLALNSGMTDARVTLPRTSEAGVWVQLVDTAHRELQHTVDDGWICLAPYSLVLLRHGLERRRLVTGALNGATEAAP